MPPGTPAPVAALVAITAIALVLRVIGMNGGLWWDEIRTLVDSVRQPLRHIVTVFPGTNQHTLYSVLAHASVAAFGESPWALRLPAVLFGTATPAVLFCMAREFTEPREATLAALLLAVSYHHVWFSQNARGYTLLAFAAVFCTWLLLRGLRRGRAGDFVGYGIAAGLGAYTHLTMIFVVAAHAIACAVALGWPRRQSWSAWRLPMLGFVVAAATTLLLYAPLLPEMQRLLVRSPSPSEGYTPGWAAGEMLRGLRIGMGSVLGGLAAALMIGVGAASYLRRSPLVFALFVLPAIVTVVAALAAARPVFPRFLFFLIGFGVLLLVRGALVLGGLVHARLRRPARAAPSPGGLALVTVLIVLSAGSLAFDYRYPKQDFGGALRFVERARAPSDVVVTAGPAMYPYREYFRMPWPGVSTLGELQAARATGHPVWVLYTMASHIRRPAPDLWAVLQAECGIAAVFPATVAEGDVTVCVFPPPPAVAPS